MADHGLIFLSHRREILYHAYQHFKQRYLEDRWIGIEMGEMHATGVEDFLFVSVDSLGRLMSNRIFKYRWRHFGIIVADEAHHLTPGGTWDNILTYFGVGSQRTDYRIPKTNLKPLLVGLTATSQRADGVGLHHFFDAVAIDYGPEEGVRDGWLTPVDAYRIGSRYGLDEEARNDLIIKGWREYAHGLKTLCFVGGVDQSRELVATLHRHDTPKAFHVDAHTDKDLRRTMIERFQLPYMHEDAINFMSNVGIFLEGTDIPGIQCVIDDAETGSQGAFIQKIGRGLRTSADAQVDRYSTPEERRQAIAVSEKPSLIYLTTFEIKHTLNMAANLAGGDPDEKERHVNEIIDVIIYEDEVIPEIPVRDEEGILSLEVFLSEQSVWNNSVFNGELHEMSPLRWTREEKWAAIFIPVNPFAKGDPTLKTPCIALWRQKRNGTWDLTTATYGGYVATLRRAVVSQVHDRNYNVPTLRQALAVTDRTIKNRFPNVWEGLHRMDNSAPDQQDLDRLKREQIMHAPQVSRGTARTLWDDWRIKRKLTELKLI